MSVPSAKEMAQALGSVYGALNDGGLLQNHHVIQSLTGSLKKYGDSTNWSISVDRGQPILFRQIQTEDKRSAVPQIVAEKIEVKGDNPFPYISWDIALEVHYTDNDREPLARWHFDLGNSAQAGPKLHMQCGGHFHDKRSFDLKIKEPRWNCPGVDLILLAEIVAANFYPEQWSKIRDTQNWCRYIHQSQKLCFQVYLDKITDIMEKSSKTVLNEMWNDRW